MIGRVLDRVPVAHWAMGLLRVAQMGAKDRETQRLIRRALNLELLARENIVDNMPSGARPQACDGDSGLAWAEGTLWVGQYRDRKIHQVDPQTGAILRTIESNRFVTGVTWIDGELWHGTWEGDDSDLRRVDPHTAEVLERLEMPPGVGVSGLESDGGNQFFCGGGSSGKVRTVRRPKQGSATGSGSEIPVDSTSK